MRTLLIPLAALFAYAAPAAAQPVYARPVETGPEVGYYVLETPTGDCMGVGVDANGLPGLTAGTCTDDRAVKLNRAGNGYRLEAGPGLRCVTAGSIDYTLRSRIFPCDSGNSASQTFVIRRDPTLGRDQLVFTLEGREYCLRKSIQRDQPMGSFVSCTDRSAYSRFAFRRAGPMLVQPARNDPPPTGSRSLPLIQPLILVPPLEVRPADGIYRIQAADGSCFALGLADPERGTALARLTPHCPTGTQFRIKNRGKTAEGKDRFSIEAESSGLCLRGSAGIGILPIFAPCGSDESYWFEMPVQDGGHQIRKQTHCFTIPPISERFAMHPCQRNPRPEQRFTLLPI